MHHQYRQNADLRDLPVNRRAELILGIATAFFVATGLAAALVHWWAS